MPINNINSAQQSLTAVMAEWPAWRDAGLLVEQFPKLLQVFNDGLNHDVALIETIADGRTNLRVLKCFSGAQKGAIQAQQWASELGVAPVVSYADADFTYCLSSFISGDTVNPKAIKDSEISLLAKALNTVHSAPLPEFVGALGSFDLMDFCEQYLQKAGQRAQQLHQQLIEPLSHFLDDTTPVCFCHNDLVVGNCFVNEERAQLIDWEYAQMHNPWFDLAAIIYYLQLDDKQAERFLDSYQPGWSVFVGTQIFYASQLALLWGDMLWHLAKFGPEFWPRLEVKLADLEQLKKLSHDLA